MPRAPSRPASRGRALRSRRSCPSRGLRPRRRSRRGRCAGSSWSHHGCGSRRSPRCARRRCPGRARARRPRPGADRPRTLADGREKARLELQVGVYLHDHVIHHAGVFDQPDAALNAAAAIPDRPRSRERACASSPSTCRGTRRGRPRSGPRVGERRPRSPTRPAAPSVAAIDAARRGSIAPRHRPA